MSRPELRPLLKEAAAPCGDAPQSRAGQVSCVVRRGRWEHAWEGPLESDILLRDVIDDDLVMTCHHVVDGQDTITIEDASGQTAAATLVEELTVSDVDVAVLRVSSRAPVVLPLGSAPTQPEEVWISGFQLQCANLRGPLPTGPSKRRTT